MALEHELDTVFEHPPGLGAREVGPKPVSAHAVRENAAAAQSIPQPAAGAAAPRAPFKRGLLPRFYPLLAELWQFLDMAAVALALYFVTMRMGGQVGARHATLMLLTAALMLAVYSWSDIFYRLRTRSLAQEAVRLLHAWGIVLMIVIAIGYLTQDQFPRDFFVAWGVLGYLIQLAAHISVRKTLHFVRRHGYNIRRALVVGCGAPLQRNVRLITQHPWLGIRIEGFVANPSWLTDVPHRGDSNVPHLGSLEDIDRLVQQLAISEIYVALPLERSADAEQALSVLVNVPVNVNWLPDFSVANVLSTRSDELGGQSIILLSDSRIERHGRLFKRFEDIFVAASLLVLIAPIMAAIALAVKLSSPGPVFFKQHRLGIGGTRFLVWKFRTMRAAASGEEARQATPGDSRVTAVGRLLRRWSLDELPQLFNVLDGSMSLVGPRPHPLWLNDKFSRVIHRYMQRHRVKPGITGWAQVNGYRGETHTEEKMSERVKYDLYYITHWSPLLDLRILVRTIAAVVRGDNAY